MELGFKFTLVSLQSLIFLNCVYYLTQWHVDKNNLANFKYFPQGPSLFASAIVNTGFLCPFSTSPALAFFLLNSHPLAHPQVPASVARQTGIFRVAIFSLLLCQSQVWGGVVSPRPDLTLGWQVGFEAYFRKLPTTSLTGALSSWSCLGTKSRALRIFSSDEWITGFGSGKPGHKTSLTENPTNQLHVQDCRDEWEKWLLREWQEFCLVFRRQNLN